VYGFSVIQLVIFQPGRRIFTVGGKQPFNLYYTEPMPVLIENQVTPHAFREGASRRLLHTNDLMVVVIDFFNGPWTAPDPYHKHTHEQISYVASGELIFFCEGEKEKRLSAGDMFSVPSDKLHTIQLLSERARLVDSFNPVREDFIS